MRLPADLLALVGALTPEALTPDLVVGLAAGLGLGGEPGPGAGHSRSGWRW